MKWGYSLAYNLDTHRALLLPCLFYLKLRPSGVGLKFPGRENIPRLLANGAKVAQNLDARKAVSATLSVLK